MLERITSIPGYNLIFLVLGIVVSTAIHLSIHRSLPLRDRIEVLAMYAIGIVGFSGITSFFVHTIWADEVARSIGWAAGSPFQTEVAGANLGIGIIGYLGFVRKDFWLPFLIAKFGFSWTAGVTHVVDIVEGGNWAVNNAGPIVYWDFLAPIALLALYLMQRDPTRPSARMRWRDGRRRADDALIASHRTRDDVV